MNLSDKGESRVRGYLFILERSLRTFLPPPVVSDATREVESHIRERVAEADGSPNERDALERILTELGSPLRVARAYASEITIDEAVTTGRLGAVLRAVWHVATTSVGGFFGGLALLVGYTFGLGFVAIAILKPIFPANVGLWTRNGVPVSFGAMFPPPPGETLVTGAWVYFVGLGLGLTGLVLTHRAARRWLAWLRSRRRPAAQRFNDDMSA